MVNIIKSDKLVDEIKDYDLILVGTNCYCTMPQGFPRKVMLFYPYTLEQNMKTKYGDIKKLGTILECKEDNQPTFVLCFICKGYNFRPHAEKEYLSYEALEKCLKLINIIYKGKKIASTLLGASPFDGNGDKERIIKMFNDICTDIDLTIYDFEQISLADECRRIYYAEKKLKESDYDAYHEAVKKRKAIEKKIKELNGHTGK